MRTLVLESVGQELSTAVRSAVIAIKASLQCGAVRRGLIAVIVTDALVLATYVCWAAAVHFQLEHNYFYDKAFFSSADWSLMEIAGYIKELVCVLMLGLISWRTRSSLFAALTLFVVVILADDSLEFHESIGAALAARGVSKPISQAVGACMMSVLPFAVVAAGWIGANETQRRDAGAVLVSIAILLFFAVGVDTIHELIKQITADYGKIFALFEDGGELLSLTLMVAVVAGLVLRTSQPASRDSRLVRSG